jgi:carboxymethylenebutenolidase
VTYPDDIRVPASGGRDMRAFLALPEADEPRPGVLVLHEIFGLNDDIRRIATRFAANGYVALAPDLFDGPGPRLLCIARVLRSLRSGGGPAFDDLDGVRQWLADRDEVDASRIGVAGFCMGGGFATLYAVRAPVGVAAPFYGEVPQTADELRGICPVVAGYGAKDRIFAGQGRRLDRLLEELGIPRDVEIYDGTGHSFMSPHEGLLARIMAFGPMAVGYDEAAAEHSWERMLRFFRTHLDGAETELR